MAARWAATAAVTSRTGCILPDSGVLYRPAEACQPPLLQVVEGGTPGSGGGGGGVPNAAPTSTPSSVTAPIILSKALACEDAVKEQSGQGSQLKAEELKTLTRAAVVPTPAASLMSLQCIAASEAQSLLNAINPAAQHVHEEPGGFWLGGLRTFFSASAHSVRRAVAAASAASFVALAFATATTASPRCSSTCLRNAAFSLA